MKKISLGGRYQVLWQFEAIISWNPFGILEFVEVRKGNNDILMNPLPNGHVGDDDFLKNISFHQNPVECKEELILEVLWTVVRLDVKLPGKFSTKLLLAELQNIHQDGTGLVGVLGILITI